MNNEDRLEDAIGELQLYMQANSSYICASAFTVMATMTGLVSLLAEGLTKDARQWLTVLSTVNSVLALILARIGMKLQILAIESRKIRLKAKIVLRQSNQ